MGLLDRIAEVEMRRESARAAQIKLQADAEARVLASAHNAEKSRQALTELLVPLYVRDAGKNCPISRSYA